MAFRVEIKLKSNEVWYVKDEYDFTQHINYATVFQRRPSANKMARIWQDFARRTESLIWSGAEVSVVPA